MIKIYENDSYIKEFNTKIKLIHKENKEIELAETAFYAKGGGQPGDIGEIISDRQKIDIKSTIKSGKSIVNILETIEDLKVDKQLIERVEKYASIKHIIKNNKKDDEKIYDLINEIIRALSNIKSGFFDWTGNLNTCTFFLFIY